MEIIGSETFAVNMALGIQIYKDSEYHRGEYRIVPSSDSFSS